MPEYGIRTTDYGLRTTDYGLPSTPQKAATDNTHSTTTPAATMSATA